MWTSVNWYSPISKYCLFIGRENGYSIVRVFSSKKQAKLFCLFHNVTFIEKN